MSRARFFFTALGMGVLALGAGFLLATATATKSYSADKGGVPTANPNIFADAPVAKVSWTGIYIGGNVGYGAADAALSSGGGFGIDGFSATGKLGGIDAGADWQIPGSFLVLGVRGGYTWSNVEFNVAPGLIKASIDDGWNIDGRLGVALGTAMPYFVVGYTTVHTSASFGSTSLNSPDLRGWRFGPGVEFRLPKMDTGTFLTPTLGLEVLYTNFDDKTFGSTKLDVTELSAMARLNLRFGRDYTPAYAPAK